MNGYNGFETRLGITYEPYFFMIGKITIIKYTHY